MISEWMTIVAVMLVLVCVAGCEPDAPQADGPLIDIVQNELAAETADSDAAVILSRALLRAQGADKKEAEAIFIAARNRAADARAFKIIDEAPLPQGWPRPSLPGLIRLKTYPPVRTAWVRDPEKTNRQFMVLFRHIKAQQVAMTSPVVMEYDSAATKDASKMADTKAMAFLYRRPDQAKAGEYGQVAVGNEEPLRVVSVGLMGSYRTRNFRKALEKIQAWLADRPDLRQVGPPRVLGYNSPFMPYWKKYSEVQIPVVTAD